MFCANFVPDNFNDFVNLLGAGHGAHKQNGRALGAPGRCGVIAVGDQAMNTAMKASRKISTPPATGSTTGIMGTMDSMTSCGWSCDVWAAGLDMVCSLAIGEVGGIVPFQTT